MVPVKGIKKIYGDKVAIEDVSFTAGAGKLLDF